MLVCNGFSDVMDMMPCLQTGQFTAGQGSSGAVQPDTEAAAQQGAGGEGGRAGASEGHSQQKVEGNESATRGGP